MDVTRAGQAQGWRARAGRIAGLGLMSSLFLLGGCARDPEVRYRVTVQVDDNGVTRSGSSVWSWALREPTLALAASYSGTFQGEAVIVELSGGRTIFAILRGADGDEGAARLLPERLFGDIGRETRGEPRLFASDRLDDLRDIAARTGERRTLDCTRWPGWCPMLVTFTDPDDPKTVTPLQLDDLSSGLGPGVRLEQVTVEITNDPVTVGIGRSLPSYGAETGFDAWYRTLAYGDPRSISRSDFQQGTTS